MTDEDKEVLTVACFIGYALLSMVAFPLLMIFNLIYFLVLR